MQNVLSTVLFSLQQTQPLQKWKNYCIYTHCISEPELLLRVWCGPEGFSVQSSAWQTRVWGNGSVCWGESASAESQKALLSEQRIFYTILIKCDTQYHKISGSLWIFMSEVNWVNHKRVLELIFILDPEKKKHHATINFTWNFIFTIIFSLVQSGQSFNVPNVLTKTLRSQKWPSSTCRCWRPKNQHIRCPAETSAVLGTDTPPRHTQHQCGATVCFLHLYEKFMLIIFLFFF